MNFNRLPLINDSLSTSTVPNHHLKEVFYGTYVEARW